MTDRERVAEAIERILSAPKYGRRESQSMFSSFWDRIWRNLLEWLDSIVSGLPGGPRLFFTALGLLALILIAWAVFRLGARRNRQLEAQLKLERRQVHRFDPAQLERQAESASREGNFREAVRLRFLAGLLRLDEQKVISYRPGLTGGEVAEVIDDDRYELLASAFDEIVYGDRLANATDDQSARQGWTRVLAGSDRP